MKAGDIVIIPFPFSELTNIKVRPAAVIAETKDKYHDLIICAVSSQIPLTPNANEIIIDSELSNGLRVKSVIKMDRIFTLKKEKVISKIGGLNVSQLTNFKIIFKSLID
ncbi:MAG: type II toxin-antitoxin system PemK/MazF family toxin [Ginsengibacter sp.]